MAIQAHNIIQDYQGVQAPPPPVATAPVPPAAPAVPVPSAPPPVAPIPPDAVVQLTQQQLQQLATTAATTAAQDVRARLNPQITALQGQVTTLTDQHNALQGRVTGLEDERTNLQGQVTRLEGERDTLQGRVTQIENQRREELLEEARRLGDLATRVNSNGALHCVTAAVSLGISVTFAIPTGGWSLLGLAGYAHGFYGANQCTNTVREMNQRALELEQLATQTPAPQVT